MKLGIDEMNRLYRIESYFCNIKCKDASILKGSGTFELNCIECPFMKLEKLIDDIIDRRSVTVSAVHSEGMVVITAEGDIYVKKSAINLEELQSVVGGYIEPVPVTVGNGQYIMIVNEEGKLQNLPYNLCATRIRNNHRRTEDFIVGDVAIVKQQGEDLIGLSTNDLLDFMNYDQLMEVLL